MDNYDMMKQRLEWHGGIHQEDRMIKNKWRSLQRALKYSYQACTVLKVQPYSEVLDATTLELDSTETYNNVRALINPDKVKQDYDDKILSIDHLYGYGPGDVFEWKKTNTYWIIYLEEITEDAYFRGEIRRCRYTIKFKDEDGNWCATWAAIRGPVETQINYILKNQVSIDLPNLSLNILIPLNEKTLRAFERYSEFLFAGRCWRVKAHDTISMRNIIEINAEEDYVNKDTDDIENEMKNGLVIEPIDPTPESEIEGNTFIKPKITEIYIAPAAGGTWSAADENGGSVPVRICAVEDDEYSVQVTWFKSTSGLFNLYWTNGEETYEKTIVVESLF